MSARRKRQYHKRVDARLLRDLDTGEVSAEDLTGLLDASLNSETDEADAARELLAWRALGHYTAGRQQGASHEDALELAGKALKKSAAMMDKALQEIRQRREEAFAATFRGWCAAGRAPDAALLHAMYTWGYGDARVDLRGRVAGLEGALRALKSHACERLDEITLKPLRGEGEFDYVAMNRR